MSRAHMSMGVKAIFATVCVYGAHALAATDLPADAGTIESIGKWPITIALIALSGWSVWLMFKQAENSRQTSDKMAEKLGELAANLNQRPCIRNKEND